MVKFIALFLIILSILASTFIGMALYGKSAIEQYYFSKDYEPNLLQFKLCEFKFYLVGPKQELSFFFFLYQSTIGSSEPVIDDQGSIIIEKDSLIGIQVYAHWSPLYGIIPSDNFFR